MLKKYLEEKFEDKLKILSLTGADTINNYSFLKSYYQKHNIQDNFNFEYLSDFNEKTGYFSSGEDQFPFRLTNESFINDKNQFFLYFDLKNEDKPLFLLIRLKEGSYFKTIDEYEGLVYKGYFDFKAPVYEFVIDNNCPHVELSGKIAFSTPDYNPTFRYIDIYQNVKWELGDFIPLLKLLIKAPFSTISEIFHNYKVSKTDFGSFEKFWDTVDEVITASELLTSKIIFIPRGKTKAGCQNEIHYNKDDGDEPIIAKGIDDCNFDFIYYLAWLRKNYPERGLKVKEKISENDLKELFGKNKFLNRYNYSWATGFQEKSRQKAKYKAISESNNVFTNDLKLNYSPIGSFNGEIVLNLEVDPDLIFLLPFENILYRI